MLYRINSFAWLQAFSHLLYFLHFTDEIENTENTENVNLIKDDITGGRALVGYEATAHHAYPREITLGKQQEKIVIHWSNFGSLLITARELNEAESC